MDNKLQIDGASSLSFACKGCGRCCGSPPQMSIREAVGLADVFVLEASILSVPFGTQTSSDIRGKMAEMTRERTDQLGGYRCGGMDPWGRPREFVVSVSALATLPNSQPRCPVVLSDGSCGIYARRPSVCRYVPAQHLVHRDQQHLSLRVFFAAHAEDCDWSHDAPVILENGRIVDPEMSAALDMAEEDDRRDGRLLAALIDGGYGFEAAGAAIDIDELVAESMARPEGLQVPFVMLLLLVGRLEEEGELPDGYGNVDVREFALRQAGLCGTAIQQNLARKARRDRDATQRLRHLQQANQMVADFLAGAS